MIVLTPRMVLAMAGRRSLFVALSRLKSEKTKLINTIGTSVIIETL